MTLFVDWSKQDMGTMSDMDTRAHHVYHQNIQRGLTPYEVFTAAQKLYQEHFEEAFFEGGEVFIKTLLYKEVAKQAAYMHMVSKTEVPE